MRITQRLIETLGYSSGEIDYNAQNKNLRPDYSVSIPEYPVRACFIIEDKNTSTENLRKHRPQLQSYMAQSGAPRGMLINGHMILVYDQMEGGLQTPAVEIPLVQAIEAWQGKSLFATGKTKVAALEESGILPSFSSLWRRFRRSSFSNLTTLIDDLTLQNEKGNNNPHKPNGKTWTKTYSRIPIIPITSDNANKLTEAIKGLIGEFEDDADAQLAAIEQDYRLYQEAAKQIPTEGTSLAQQEGNLAQTALQLMAGADQESKDYDETLLRKIMRSEVLVDELKQIERRMYGLHAITAKNKKGNDKDPIYMLMSQVRAFTIKRYRYISKLQAQHEDSIKVVHHIETWKEKTASLVFQSDDNGLLRREFLAQTAYLVIIRILLVRIMEDKGLVNRMFTNGGVSLWFRDVESHYLEHAIGRSADFLLDIAYTSAQHIYAHFFSERTVLDWYIPDRNAVVRVLHTLAGFDLSDINRDIIGTVYNQYVEAKHKHESGMYFTPPEVVSFMLDRIGYKGTDIIGKKLIDLSCGSGGFLVEAATRLVDAYKDYWKKASATGKIPAENIQTILDEIRDSLHGVDLNPFACSLAETNLLIQVIDLFSIAYKSKNRQAATIDRFHIYNSDSLSFSADTLASLAGTLPFPDDELPVEDQVKAGVGNWRKKFDFVVGNPPYVKANEGTDMGVYRERIKKEYPSDAVRNTMVQKWDLFVPFVAASFNLLKPEQESEKPGQMAIITSNAVETVPYCDALRDLLVSNATVDEVHFFPGIKLFEDAVVQNTITVATRRAPNGHAHTERFWHKTAPKWGTLSLADTQKLRQLQYRADIFRQELPELVLGDAVTAMPLEDVFYISKGMVLNADEKTNRGAFKMEDLIVDRHDNRHPAPFAGSKDVDYFGIKNIRYLEYGDETRVPEKISRKTFPELYDRPKLMVAEFGGFAYDDGTWDDAGFLKCNHSVFLLMQWHQLKGVDAKSIKNDLGERVPLRAALEAKSAAVDPWYVLAFLNSQQMRTLLDGVNRSAIAGRLQPDDLRQISIPIPNDENVMAEIADLSKQASDIQKQLLPLRMQSWMLEGGQAVAPAAIPDGIPVLAFDRARVKWGLEISGSDFKVGKLARENHRLFSGKREALRISSSAPEEAMEWLRRQLLTYPEGTTLGEIETSKSVVIPETPELAAKALALLLKEEQRVGALLSKIGTIRAQISERLDSLFKETEHPPIKEGKKVA